MTRFIDLTHALADGLPNFAGDPQLRIRAHHAMPEKPCNVIELTLSSHQGTHLDAPFHFYREGRTVDEIPLERFFGPASLIDLAPRGALAPATPLGVEHFRPHEHVFRPGARIVYRTGWGAYFGTPKFFTDFPTLTVEAAQWMAGKGIALLGMDTPTPGTDFVGCHLALLAPGVEIVIVEALAGLERLPAHFTLAVFPLKIKAGDGAPIRAVALVEE
jgi:kynurenine formamidase